MKLNTRNHHWLFYTYLGFLPLLTLLFLLNSCSFGLLEGYQKSAQVSIAPVSWFRTDSDHLLMNTTIDVMKNHFSGLMVIKSEPDEGFRIVFITETGLKIFDMEFFQEAPVKVHYFMEALNKKILVKTLSGDLKLLLVLPGKDEKTVVYESLSAPQIVKYKNKRMRNYYEISPRTGKPIQAFQTSGTSKKVRIDYYSEKGETIDSVKIIHEHVKLRIDMRLINENSKNAVR
jgi:hypothetical protein